MGKFYLTTTLPYVNAPPHIGFALELVQADVIARYHRLLGEEVVFNTGTDEHGLKIYRAAQAERKDPQAYVDEHAAAFDKLKAALNVSYKNFIRTSEPHHKKAAQEFWQRCKRSGDIYKQFYKVKYCVGCELEKTDSELTDGRCPIHPNLELEIIEEENYFFRFSKYQDKLLALYRENPRFVLPEFRLHEIRTFVEGGLKDFSISRVRKKLPWGVAVPGDEEHVMYVWFDALVNYISTLGWPEDEGRSRGFWPGVQIAGKDNLRQQAAMWQAMLLSAGLPTSKQILIHGFVTSSGEKMSKSLGNVVDPFLVVEEYGADAVRYYLLREIPSDDDGDFSESKFKDRFNGDLANGLGNFASRVLTLASRYDDLDGGKSLPGEIARQIEKAREAVKEKIENFKLHEALQEIWGLVAFGDTYVNLKKPWEKEDPQAIFNLVALLDNVAALLAPFLPETAEKITKCIRWEGKALRVRKGELLFPRLAN
jgi:methionyl-tRNA synthetase